MITTIGDIEYSEQCYIGASGAFTPPATPTDMFYIGGSATKVIKIFKLWIATVQTTSGINNMFLVKRSAANSAGTAVATTRIPMVIGSSAATALVQHYTANPTINGTVGNMWAGKLDSPAITTTSIGGMVGMMLDFSALFGQPITLNGTAEAVAFNFNGAALPAGLSVMCTAMWSES